MEWRVIGASASEAACTSKERRGEAERPEPPADIDLEPPGHALDAAQAAVRPCHQAEEVGPVEEVGERDRGRELAAASQAGHPPVAPQAQIQSGIRRELRAV